MQYSKKELYGDVWGDSTLYAGMLVAIGDVSQWGYVNFGCIDTEGRIWRNPEDREKGEDYPNSSSRDMLMGALLGASRGALLDIANYLKKNKGLICPTATDNRNKLGVMGWANLGDAIRRRGKWSIRQAVRHMGWKGYLIYVLFRPLLGFTTFMEALTALKGYQINLVYAALFLHAMNERVGWWYRQTLRVLDKVRGQDDLVFHYLNGNAAKVKSEVLHMRNRRAATKNRAHHGAYGWPPSSGSSYHFTSNYTSEVYAYWVEKAALSVDSYIKLTGIDNGR